MGQTHARGEIGATLERMGGEEGIVPERSEWFRSKPVIRSPIDTGSFFFRWSIFIPCLDAVVSRGGADAATAVR